MKYYIVTEDQRIKEPVKVAQYTEKNYKEKEDVVIFAECSENTKYVSYIKKRFLFETSHIVSDSVKEVMEMYEGSLSHKGIFITDKKTLNQYIYWEVQPEQIDCIQPEGADSISKAGFVKSLLKEKLFFTVPFQKQEYLLMRMDVVESIMRRYCLGIQFHEARLV